MSLHGKTILVTRAEGQASVLAEMLRNLGAKPWVLPAIEIVPVAADIESTEDFDWVVFTSSNAARHFATQLLQRGVALPERCRLAAVGPTTAQAVRDLFGRVDASPATFLAREILPLLGDVSGLSFLLPRGDLARDDLPRALHLAGAKQVVSLEVYRTTAAPWPDEIQGTPDLITFTSSSGVLATHERLAERNLLHWLQQVPCVCIGPLTAGTLRDLGVEPAGEATEHSIPGLVAAVQLAALQLPSN